MGARAGEGNQTLMGCGGGPRASILLRGLCLQPPKTTGVWSGGGSEKTTSQLPEELG